MPCLSWEPRNTIPAQAAEEAEIHSGHGDASGPEGLADCSARCDASQGQNDSKRGAQRVYELIERNRGPVHP